MKSDKIVKRLKEQTKSRRLVIHLLAFVNEEGPQPPSVLRRLSGESNPLDLARRGEYLTLTPDGKFSITDDGTEVLTWILGLSPEPTKWRHLEKGIIKRLIRKGVRV